MILDTSKANQQISRLMKLFVQDGKPLRAMLLVS